MQTAFELEAFKPAELRTLSGESKGHQREKTNTTTN